MSFSLVREKRIQRILATFEERLKSSASGEPPSESDAQNIRTPKSDDSEDTSSEFLSPVIDERLPVSDGKLGQEKVSPIENPPGKIEEKKLRHVNPIDTCSTELPYSIFEESELSLSREPCQKSSEEQRVEDDEPCSSVTSKTCVQSPSEFSTSEKQSEGLPKTDVSFQKQPPKVEDYEPNLGVTGESSAIRPTSLPIRGYGEPASDVDEPASDVGEPASDVGASDVAVSSGQTPSPRIRGYSLDQLEEILLTSLTSKKSSERRLHGTQYHRVVSLNDNTCPKCEYDAELFRVRGNSSIPEHRKIQDFTRSLASAKDLIAIAFAYLGRAEALKRVKEYDLSILDVHRALALDKQKKEDGTLFYLPERIYNSLQMVKLKSMMKMYLRRDYRRMTIEYSIGNGSWEDLKEEEKTFSRHIARPEYLGVDDYVDEQTSLDKIWATRFHPTVKGLANARLEYNEKDGWHWRAKELIPAGETLSIEKYYASVLSLDPPSNLYKYCSHCTMWSLALIPCLKCKWALYCGTECRKEAKKMYHKIECAVLPHIPELRRKESAMLILRIFLTGTDQGRTLASLNQNYEVFEHMFHRDKLNLQDKKPSDPYITILGLMWNDRDSDSSLLKISRETYDDVVKIFIALRKINFFYVPDQDVSQYNRGLSNDVEKMGALLLLHHASLLSFNGSDLYAHYLNNENKLRKIKIAVGLSVFHSFINHSCNPNAMLVRERRRELVFTLGQIYEDEQAYFERRERAVLRFLLCLPIFLRSCVEIQNQPLPIDVDIRLNVELNSLTYHMKILY